MPKQYSYNGNYPVALKISIHDQDVTDALASVDAIVKGIDYPILTEFRVGETQFTIRDIHGDFAPNNASNFFTQHGGRRTGRHSPVTIEAGFIVDGHRHTETLFQGTIIKLTQDAKAATVTVVCTDNFGDIRTKTIADFGIPRHFRLLEQLEHAGENGVYPVMDAVLPAAQGSVTLKTEVTGQEIPPVQKLKTEGSLDPLNYVVDADGVHTEGGVIENPGTGYPQLKMKSPYRARHLKDVIADLLTHAGIIHSDIAIPPMAVPAHFSSNGRVNYELIGNIGSSNPITWNGYVTDMLKDSAAGQWYFLYNKHRHNPNGFSQIIAYDIATRTYTKLHDFQPAATLEVWKFIKVGDTFYVLATTGGTYDAKAPACKTEIVKVDISSNTPVQTEFVRETATLQPQLAHYYHGVGAVFMKPDSRRKMIYHANALYYGYVDAGNSVFGVAKVSAGNSPASVISCNFDGYGNHAAFSFNIRNGTLTLDGTFVSGNKSQDFVAKKAV